MIKVIFHIDVYHDPVGGSLLFLQLLIFSQ